MTSPYSLFLAAGVLASLVWLAVWGQAQSRTAALDAGLACLAGGLVGARIAFIASHLHLYTARPLDALYFWQGGLAWAGAAAGGVVGLGLYAAVSRHQFWVLADALAVPAGVLSLTSWAGCWAESCAYGRRAEAGWLTPASADLFGLVAPRWPTQPLGILLSLGALGVLAWLQGQRHPAGTLAGLALAMIAATALALSFLRGDSVPGVFGLRLEAVGSGVVLALSGLAASWRAWKGGER